MTKRTLACSSALLISLLTLGSSALAAPVGNGGIDLGRLRAAQGPEGIGLGALVIPSYSELGEFTINLYNDQDEAIYWVSGSMSLYLPTTFVANDRGRFGGFSGTLRSLEGPVGSHPLFVGSVEGTWEMDGHGVGTLDGVAYRLDGTGARQPFGVILGEFEALEIVWPEEEGAAGPGGAVGGGGLSYGYLAGLRAVQAQLAGDSSFTPVLNGARVVTNSTPFGMHDLNQDLRIRHARRQAASSAMGHIEPGAPSGAGSAALFGGGLTAAEISAARLQNRIMEARKFAQNVPQGTSGPGAPASAGSGGLIAADLSAARLQNRIMEARKAAQGVPQGTSGPGAPSAAGSSPLSGGPMAAASPSLKFGVPVETHLAAKILVHYKFVN